MAAAKVARPLLFCGIVPRGVSTAEVGKALLKRFTLADVHGVQDFQSGQTEILFKHMKAVEKTLSESTLRIGEHTVKVQLPREDRSGLFLLDGLAHQLRVCCGLSRASLQLSTTWIRPCADNRQNLGLVGSCPCSERRLRSVLVALWLWV